MLLVFHIKALAYKIKDFEIITAALTLEIMIIY